MESELIKANTEKLPKVVQQARELSEKFQKKSRRNYQPSQREREEAAERYALADKSDPFVRGRMRTHMKNGVAGFNQNGEDAFYSADEHMEERRLDNGTRYEIPTYRNRVRP